MAGPNSIIAEGGSNVTISEHIHNGVDLQKLIGELPEEDESFAKATRTTALNIVGDTLKDMAKGQFKEGAKQIVQLGKDLSLIGLSEYGAVSRRSGAA